MRKIKERISSHFYLSFVIKTMWETRREPRAWRVCQRRRKDSRERNPREEWSRDFSTGPTSSSSSDKNVLLTLGHFTLHRKACSWTLSPLLPVGARGAGSAMPFLWRTHFQAQRSTSHLILPLDGRVHSRTVVRKRLSISQVSLSLSCACVYACVCTCVYACVCVLLAHSAPINHHSCKWILCSCKFPFSMTTPATIETGKGFWINHSTSLLPQSLFSKAPELWASGRRETCTVSI